VLGQSAEIWITEKYRFVTPSVRGREGVFANRFFFAFIAHDVRTHIDKFRVTSLEKMG